MNSIDFNSGKITIPGAIGCGKSTLYSTLKPFQPPNLTDEEFTDIIKHILKHSN